MEPWIRCMRTGFLTDPGRQLTEATLDWWRRGWDSTRIWGSYEHGRCVSTLRTFPTTLSVPNAPFDDKPCAEVPADALTQVTVAATHRRRGILTRTLTQSLTGAHERGEVLSVLRAAEWPIYGRFGYAVSAQAADYRLNSWGGVVVAAPVQTVTVRQLDPADFLTPASRVLGSARLQRPGAIARSEAMWERILGLRELSPTTEREPVCVIAEDGVSAVGYAIWTAKDGDFFVDDGMELKLHELVSTTEDGYRALWSYVANVDLVRSVAYTEKAVDEPLEFQIADGRRMRRETVWDGLWLRLLDVPAALSSRRYAFADRIVLEVIDDDAGGWAAGRFALDGGPDGAECVRAPERNPDLTIHQRALAACYLGGQSLGAQERLGLVDEHASGAIAKFGRMLLTDTRPWNSTEF
jgi:predicted acetyltransferase